MIIQYATFSKLAGDRPGASLANRLLYCDNSPTLEKGNLLEVCSSRELALTNEARIKCDGIFVTWNSLKRFADSLPLLHLISV